MRLFWEIARRSFHRHLTYRTAIIAGLLTNFFFGWLRVSVLLALYDGRSIVEGITVTGLYTYVALTQAIISYIAFFGWADLMNSVYTGKISSDLLKPMHYFRFWLAKDAGRALVALLLRGVLIMLIFSTVFPILVPKSLEQWMALITAVFLSWLVSFSFRFLLNLTAFWTPNARGITRFGYAISWFLSGFLMPLRLFPEWVQTVANWTPFPHMLNTVVEVYLGIIEGEALWQALFMQIVWVVVLFIVAQLVFQKGVRRLVILGG